MTRRRVPSLTWEFSTSFKSLDAQEDPSLIHLVICLICLTSFSVIFSLLFLLSLVAIMTVYSYHKGLGMIVTTHDRLSKYLSLCTRQNPIESQFIASLTDNLNAEVRPCSLLQMVLFSWVMRVYLVIWLSLCSSRYSRNSALCDIACQYFHAFFAIRLPWAL